MIGEQSYNPAKSKTMFLSLFYFLARFKVADLF